MRYCLTLAIFCLSMLNSACYVFILPIPHTETTICEIEGVVKSNGEPVVGQTVVFNWGSVDKDKWEYTAETKTSEKGEFHFAGKSRFMPVLIGIAGVADCQFSYRLILKCPEEGNEIVLADESFLFGTVPPKRLRVKCDLAKTSRDRCSISIE